MFHSFGAPEIALIVFLVLIVFGVGKLPQVGGAIGKGIREFRKGKAGELDSSNEQEKPEEKKEETK